MNELQNSFEIQYLRKRKKLYNRKGKTKGTLKSNVCAEHLFSNNYQMIKFDNCNHQVIMEFNVLMKKVWFVACTTALEKSSDRIYYCAGEIERIGKVSLLYFSFSLDFSCAVVESARRLSGLWLQYY